MNENVNDTMNYTVNDSVIQRYYIMTLWHWILL